MYYTNEKNGKKVGLLNLAEELGYAFKACGVVGFSRQMIYHDTKIFKFSPKDFSITTFFKNIY